MLKPHSPFETMTTKSTSTILTIAGFDGSGGAGIQADLKTFAALGCYGVSVLTALPVQNSLGVQTIYEISDACIQHQLKSIFEDIEVDAIKIGMLHRAEVVAMVIEELEKHRSTKVVFDPVMTAKNGFSLMTEEALRMIKAELFPLVSVLTPNLPEASILLGRKIEDGESMEGAAADLLLMGVGSVLLKGGHLPGNECDDCLYMAGDKDCVWFPGKRIETKNKRGTGCTYASAIAAYIAKGYQLSEAVKKAKAYIICCLKAGAQWTIGRGAGPLQHFV